MISLLLALVAMFLPLLAAEDMTSGPVHIGVETVIGLTLSVFIWSLQRNIKQLDKSIEKLSNADEHLAEAVNHFNLQLMGLTRDYAALKERSGADHAVLSERIRKVEDRFEGLARFWQDEFRQHREATMRAFGDTLRDLYESRPRNRARGGREPNDGDG